MNKPIARHQGARVSQLMFLEKYPLLTPSLEQVLEGRTDSYLATTLIRVRVIGFIIHCPFQQQREASHDQFLDIIKYKIVCFYQNLKMYVN